MVVRERLLRDALARLAEAREAVSRMASATDDWVARGLVSGVVEDAEIAVLEFARDHLGVVVRGAGA